MEGGRLSRRWFVCSEDKNARENVPTDIFQVAFKALFPTKLRHDGKNILSRKEGCRLLSSARHRRNTGKKR